VNCVDLLQSVGSKLPSKSSEKVLESSSNSETALRNDRVKYSYTDFSVVDHRVKLYLYLHVFQHEQEELLFLLRVSIFAAISTRKFATQCLFRQINIQLKYWYLIRDIVIDFTYYGIDSVKKCGETLLRCFCKSSTNQADKA